MLDKIESVLLRDDGRLLERLILSVRTTETVRDLRFLDESQIPDEGGTGVLGPRL